MASIYALIVATILIVTQSRVIEITNNNVHLVIRSVGELLLLLNNPQCPHSQAYTQRYNSLNTTQTIGLADCIKDKQLCDYLNITHYPTLLLISSKTVKHVNQHQFLQKYQLISPQSPQIALENVLKMLKDQKKWVAVVLEQQKMPSIDKISNSLDQRVVYIPNPSRLHEAISAMVGGQLGCWILLNNNGNFHRYYCGTGYKAEELQKHLSNFINKKLERHLFTKEQNSTYLETNILSGLISELGRKSSQCKLIYFYSEHCEHCDMADYELVRTLVEGKSQYEQHHVQIFDLDREQYPQGLQIKRVPELVQICKGKIRYFGQLFTIESLKTFLNKDIQTKQIPSPAEEQL